MAKKNDTAGAAAAQGSDQSDADVGSIETDPADDVNGAEGANAAAAPPEAASINAAPDPAAPEMIRALILRDCGFGEVGTVTTLERAVAETGREQGALDLSPAAIQAFGG